MSERRIPSQTNSRKPFMADFRAKKRFGQHLLRFAEDARRIARLLGEDSAPETILEVGPGGGALTSALVETYPTAEIIAVEFDRDLLSALTEQFADRPNVRFVQKDILKVDLAGISRRAHIIGNLPYNLSAPIIQWTLSQRASVCGAVFMLQREVARRLGSQPDSKDWSPLAIHTQLRFTVTPAFDLAPERFTPPPRVHSSVFALTPRKTAEDFPDYDEDSAAEFEKLVRNAFASRRKTLLNNLAGRYDFSRQQMEDILRSLEFDERVRAEQLSIGAFIRLLKSLGAGQES